jgi:Tfp pilus assembly protein PilO
MIWREKRTLLITLGVLLAANVIYFFTYGVQYQSRLDGLDERLASAEERLEQARTARMRAEQTLESYRNVERDVLVVFDEHWSTEQKRLTQLIAEVKRLAVASSLVPATINFDRAQAGRITVARRGGASIGATEVGISFSVQGTYEQVRRLVNLLELSPQFVIIDQISLGAAEGELLTLNLHVKTLFKEGDRVEGPGPRA